MEAVEFGYLPVLNILQGKSALTKNCMRELRRILPYLQRHWRQFLLGFFFITISNVFSTQAPRFVGETIDLFAQGSYSLDTVLVNIGIFLLLTAGSGIMMFFTRQQIIVASRQIEYELRNDLLLTIEHLPLRYFQQTSTGNLMAHATNDVAAAREFVGPAIMYTANTLTRFLMVLWVMSFISPVITIAALLPLPIISYLTYRIGQKVHFAFRDVQEHFSTLTATAQENLSGVRVIRAYVREQYETSVFRAISKTYLHKNIQLVKLQGLIMPAMLFLAGLSQVLVLGVGGNKVINGEVTFGELTQFFMYLNQLIWPVIAIGWVTNLVQRAAASVQRIGKIFDERRDIADSDATDTSITELQGHIEFRNVSFRYGPALPNVLRTLSIDIPAGSTLGIVGKTGSGKSSFVNLLPRLFDCTEGSVLIDGHDIRTIPLAVLRRHIAIVPQESFLFSASIAQNVLFGAPNASMDDIVEAATIAQLHGDVNNFAEGYRTIVGERGITLSGGQKQRTAIARAIIRKPSILVFDDSLSAVDTQTEENILTGMQSVMQSRTSILIAHRISTVKKADIIAVLDDGEIVEMGTHDELLALDGFYADMYKRQLLEEEIEQF